MYAAALVGLLQDWTSVEVAMVLRAVQAQGTERDELSNGATGLLRTLVQARCATLTEPATALRPH